MGHAAANTNRRRRFMPREFRVLAVLSACILPITLLWSLYDDIVWIWKNRYFYVGCPEYSLWLRPHGQTNVTVMHVTAKFGATPDAFREEVDTHVHKVMRSGIFQPHEVSSYSSFPDFITSDARWKQHLQFLGSTHHTSKRGGGFWFWKPVLIDHHLQSLQQGDFLVYTDVDRVDFVSWTPLLLETMEDRNADLALEQQNFLEREWTKQDIYNEHCPGLEQRNDASLQYIGSFVVIRKNDATVQFVQDWMQAVTNYHLISDEASRKPNIAGFMENRHDQSLLSMILKCVYGEPSKELFPWTCLQPDTKYGRFPYTFQMQSSKG